jgi:hypothetical protein
MLVTMPVARGPISGAAVALLAAAGLVAWRWPGVFDLAVMDGAWRAVVATKDYTFPTDWSGTTWAVNGLGPVLLTAGIAARHRAGVASPRERGVLAGALLLVAGFLVSLPFIASGVALAVQLQTSRIFWPVELLATLVTIWWVAERPAAGPGRPWRAQALAAVLVIAAVARGAYVGFVESPERATLAFSLPDDDWAMALGWVAGRIGAQRDAYLEETKDVAMAMYSKESAARVAARIDAVAGFEALDEAALLALARRDGLTVLVTGRRLQLPILHVQGTVTVYRLG